MLKLMSILALCAAHATSGLHQPAARTSLVSVPLRSGGTAAGHRAPSGNCLPATAIKIENPGDGATLSAFVGELITAVSIKAGTECFVTPANAIGTVTFGDCYVVEGLAAAEATVQRIGAGSSCKDISHIQYVTALASELTLCKVAGTGVELGTAFGFDVRGTTVVMPSGAPPVGSCAPAGLFAVGMQVAVSETIPVDAEVGAITCTGVATCSNVDLAAGTVTVAIGNGRNEVTYTNRRTDSGSPELCGDGIDNDRDGIADEGCIVGRAWLDRDPNIHGFTGYGVQEPGEPGIEGVLFHLFTGDGTLVASTLSDANGIYHFSGVPAGTYVVRVVRPPGLSGSSNDCIGADVDCDDTIDSDFIGGPASYDSPVLAFPADGSIDYLDAGFSVPPRD